MMGIVLNISPKERTLTLEAIEDYQTQLTPGERVFYQLTKRKLKIFDSIVDGMYMRCMENALTYKAKRSKSKECLGLVKKIEKQRLGFQLGSLKDRAAV